MADQQTDNSPNVTVDDQRRVQINFIFPPLRIIFCIILKCVGGVTNHPFLEDLH